MFNLYYETCKDKEVILVMNYLLLKNQILIIKEENLKVFLFITLLFKVLLINIFSRFQILYVIKLIDSKLLKNDYSLRILQIK